MILKVDNLSFTYAEKEILKEINLTIKKKEFLGIIGPNGSGKTTLIKNIAGFLKGEGQIEINEKSMDFMGRKEIAKKIAVVPQKSKLTGSFTVEEVVEMGRYPYQKRWQSLDTIDNDIIESVMNELDIIKFRTRKIGELSGGEFQKVIIARALAQQPEILILDEATSNLDINHTIEIFTMVKKLCKRQGIAIVAIIHDLNMASQFCDQILVLKGGKKYIIGSPEKVINIDLLGKIFGLKAQVMNNPLNKKPYIIPEINV